MNTEEYLSEYYYATNRKRDLIVNLIAAKQHYKDACDTRHGHDFNAIRSKNKQIAKPVELAAEKLLEDSLGADVKKIKLELTEKQFIIDSRESLIRAAGLLGAEELYVRIRFFERGNVKGSVEYTEKKINYEHTQAWEIWKSAREKIERVRG
jgi:hypothetical protein